MVSGKKEKMKFNDFVWITNKCWGASLLLVPVFIDGNRIYQSLFAQRLIGTF